MSLINDMLKNLEKRREIPQKNYTETSNKDYAFQEDDDAPIFMRAILAALVIIVLAGVIYIIFDYLKHRHHPRVKTENTTSLPAKVTPVAPTTTLPATAPTKPLQTPPNIASGIHVNDLPDQTQVQIDVTGSPEFISNTNNETGVVSITLANTYMDLNKVCKLSLDPSSCLANNEIPLPKNVTGIKSIHVDQNDGQSLVLAFLIGDKIQLTSTQLQGAALLLTFSKKGSNAAVGNSINVAATPSNNSIDAGPSDGDQLLQPSTTPTTGEDSLVIGFNELIAQRRLAAAHNYLDRLSSAERDSKKGIMMRSKLLMAEGDNKAALSLLQANLSNKPAPDYYALYAAALEFNGKHTEAANVYSKLVRYWPNNPDWWLGLGISSENSNQGAQAKKAFEYLLTNFDNLNPEVQKFAQTQTEALAIDSEAENKYQPIVDTA